MVLDISECYACDVAISLQIKTDTFATSGIIVVTFINANKELEARRTLKSLERQGGISYAHSRSEITYMISNGIDVMKLVHHVNLLLHAVDCTVGIYHSS